MSAIQSGPEATKNLNTDAKASTAHAQTHSFGPRRRWALRVGGATVALLLGAAALSSCGADETTATEAPAPTVTATATVTAADPTATATTTVTAEPEVTSKPKPKPKPSQNGGDTFTMPDERGKSLQGAQDDLQAVSGNPFFFSDSEDATNQGRGQWMDSGWTVCTQNRVPGTQVSVDDMDIIFGVVRESERCP